MEDIFLSDTVDQATVFVSALSHKMYRSSGARGLGGSGGYFVCLENANQPDAGFEVLAKAATVDAAQMIFSALVSSLRERQPAMTARPDALGSSEPVEAPSAARNPK